jgi:hypothetical protein
MKRKNPHAVALGRLGGQRKSPRKTAAARANGRLSIRSRVVVPEAPAKETSQP